MLSEVNKSQAKPDILALAALGEAANAWACEQVIAANTCADCDMLCN